jgi:hypothetical protein
MEQRAATTFYFRSKQTGAETFAMLRSAHGEEYLSRISVSEWHKSFKDGRDRNKMMNGKAAIELPEHENRRSQLKVLHRRSYFECSDFITNDRDQQRDNA